MSEEIFHEQINAYLLGELSTARAADFERALDADAALRGLLREREEELERMTLEIAPQVDPPPAVREALLAAAAESSRAPGPTAPRSQARAASSGWSVWFPRVLAAAAASLTLLALGIGLWARRDADDLRARVRELAAENGTLRGAREDTAAAQLATRARLEREVATLSAQVANDGHASTALRDQLARAERDLQAARTQDVFTRLQVGALRPPAGTPLGAAGGLAMWDPQRQEGMLVVENLPVPRPDQDYQVWVADPARPQPVPSGVFHPARAGGQQVLRFVTNERIEQATQFMVTLERKGGVGRITGPAVLESLPRR